LRLFEDWVTDLKREERPSQYAIALAVFGAPLLLFLLSLSYAIAKSDIFIFNAPNDQLAGVAQAIESGVATFLTGWMIALAAVVFVGGILGFVLIHYAVRRMKDVALTQKRFIAETSHAMRTPLSIMKAGIEVALLDRETLTREEAIEVLESNLQEVDRMTRMTNALLILSRLDDPTHTAVFEQLNVTGIVMGAVRRYEHAAATKNITLAIPEAPDYFVHGNGAYMETLFKQIIRNAITYTPEGGTVRVRITPVSSRKVEIAIQDTGVGISKENMIHLFKPFYGARKNTRPNPKTSSDSSLSKSPLGIGLTLARRIAKHHRGTIRVKSEVNKGSTFFITLPLT